MKPVVGLTMGDPAGIGPEIILRLIRQPAWRRKANFVIFGNRAVFDHLQLKYAWKIPFDGLQFIECSPWLKRTPPLGLASAAGGKSSGEAVQTAVSWALQSRIHAIVTAPINKEAFKKGGWGRRYPGHTEMLTALTGVKRSALMMVYRQMRVIHVTSHIPLRKVAHQINSQRVYETIVLAHQAMRANGVRHPRIGVCGLNPHAGDNGVLGTEDLRLIAPAVRRARAQKMNAEGPLSADTLWPAVWGKQFDIGVAMYHDQGQIPMKLLAFQARPNGQIEPRGVNVTIGLPIIRTSVAHGTAYSMAGKKCASPASLEDAVDLAIAMVRTGRS